MKPRIGLLLGDPNGIGPELVAKLLDHPTTLAQADVLLLGDPAVWRWGERIAAVQTPVRVVADPLHLPNTIDQPCLLALPLTEHEPGHATAAAGRAALEALTLALRLARQGRIDAICFAPLNKQALRLGGMTHEDEMQFVKDALGFDGPCGEINVLETLWTTRVTSHIPFKDVAAALDTPRIVAAIRLAYDALARSGMAEPRIAVAALNPHAGDGGLYGREEIDLIAPAVVAARAAGIAADGPFAADTVFVRARNGHYDAVVTLYHDQGQIAMKLLGFERGVTVLGGLPIPIATPAHGSAYDIVGQGKANPQAICQAFALVCRMAAQS